MARAEQFGQVASESGASNDRRTGMPGRSRGESKLPPVARRCDRSITAAPRRTVTSSGPPLVGGYRKRCDHIDSPICARDVGESGAAQSPLTCIMEPARQSCDDLIAGGARRGRGWPCTGACGIMLSSDSADSDTQKPSRRGVRRGLNEVFVPLGLLAGIGLLALCFISLTSALSVVDMGAYLLTFLTSPGATIVAAGIAAAAIVPQIWHSRTIERQRTWWENYRWLVDRAWPAKDERALPDSIVVASMEALLDSAPRPWDRVLAPAIARFAEAVTEPKPPFEEPSGVGDRSMHDAAAQPEGSRAADFSSLLVKLHRAGVVSPQLEAQRYEHEVMRAIDRAAAKHGWWTRREAAMAASDYYVAAPTETRPDSGKWLAIEIMASQSAIRRALMGNMVRDGGRPDLIVGPVENPKLILVGSSYVRWSNSADDAALEKAIESILSSKATENR